MNIVLLYDIIVFNTKRTIICLLLTMLKYTFFRKERIPKDENLKFNQNTQSFRIVTAIYCKYSKFNNSDFIHFPTLYNILYR